MADRDLDDVSRQLSASRAELQHVLGRDRHAGHSGRSAAHYYEDGGGGVLVDHEEFPRSRLMRLLLEKRMLPVGLAVLLAVAFAVNPVMARRVLRHVPLRLVATRLLTR